MEAGQTDGTSSALARGLRMVCGLGRRWRSARAGSAPDRPVMSKNRDALRAPGDPHCASSATWRACSGVSASADYCLRPRKEMEEHQGELITRPAGDVQEEGRSAGSGRPALREQRNLENLQRSIREC